MIAEGGGWIAHLGGPRGDRLSVAVDGGPLERWADLGWDAKAQAAPQRRVWTDGARVLVLEPAGGLLLDGAVRLRVFGPGGAEEPGPEGTADETPDAVPLAFFARRTDPGGRRARVVRWGLDPASGALVRGEDEIEARGWTWRSAVSGVPARAGEAWWYPLRGGGLLRVDRGGPQRFAGQPGAPAVLGARVVVAGFRGRHGGVWVDGAWTALPGVRPFGPGRIPLSPGVVAHGTGGWAVLDRAGGALGVRDGPPLRLPAGLYGGLVRHAGRVLAVDEREPPTLVAAGF